MTHMKHSYVMIGLLVVGSVLFFSGMVSAWNLFLLWPLACVVMMGVMMWAMMSMSRGGSKADDDEDEDASRLDARPPLSR